MRHFTLLVPCLSLLVGCPSASPRPDTAETTPRPGQRWPLPSPLVDASGFVAGRFVGDEGGWRFEQGERRSERVAWPRVPADHLASSPCAKLEAPGVDAEARPPLWAWPVAGTGRMLVLAEEPLIAEVSPGRPGCIVTTPARTRGVELGRKSLEVMGHEPRIVVFSGGAPDPTLEGLTLVEREGRVPLLEFAGGELEPDGLELEDVDQLGCVSPEDAQEDGLDVAPARHSVSVVWRGQDRVDELELTLTQRCTGDPSAQGGAVEFDRELHWVLERDGTEPGWRQVGARLSSDQSSSGDGVTQSESRWQAVTTWRAGPVALVGRSVAHDSGGVSRWGDGSTSVVSSDWWLVPVGVLDEGFDEATFDKLGLGLTPSMDDPQRAADARHTDGEHRLFARCLVDLRETRAKVSCAERVAELPSLSMEAGKIERHAEVWDLGLALLVKLELRREHRYQEPLSEDDPSLVEHVEQEGSGMTLLVSRRDGTILAVSRSSGTTSM